MPRTDKPRLGSLQVNSTDYDGCIVIERFDYANADEPFWHVPAWEESGSCDLAGPFATVASAEAALRAA